MKKRKLFINPDSKSQTTIFIIIAILIIISAIVFSYIQKSKSEKFFSTPENREKINNIIDQTDSCIELSISSGLETIGSQGGYYKKPANTNKEFYEESFLLEETLIPFYYSNNQAFNPSKKEVEAELKNAFRDKVKECINSINYSSLEINYKIKQPSVSIAKEKTIFIPNIKITISSGKYSTLLNFKDEISRNSALYDILDFADYITKSNLEDKEFDCISCFAEIAEEKNLYLDIYNFDETSTMNIIYENYTQDNQQLIFLNKFEEEMRDEE